MHNKHVSSINSASRAVQSVLHSKIFQGVDFDFEYSAVAAHAVVLLGEDARLREMRWSSKL